MPTPSVWGPPVWELLHTLSVKLKEEDYKELVVPLFNLMRRICFFLPCTECSEHAKKFFNKINFNNIKSRDNFINIFFIMHNNVNIVKAKPIYLIEDVEKRYKNNNIIRVYNSFVAVYNSPSGNVRNLDNSFHRRIVINELKNFLIKNIKSFL